ncbi:hypothetical protein D9V32_14075 [Mycetocola tolaasinivorans]|uniref:Uncharacterized protein n=1 Tax=Mycetocola tolaasinivorans TaxID=76635 RepID=A0A3L7A0Q7_9MICO|nr:hypothetical protein [Mycetocola tolaasinivorans]RLP73654.1 hypothetical protein D9V32_14075 [Mycetocola tolaasinivorans]
MTQRVTLSIPDRLLAAAILTERFPQFSDINVDPYRIRLHIYMQAADGKVWDEDVLRAHLAAVADLVDRWRVQPVIMLGEVELMGSGPLGLICLSLDDCWWPLFTEVWTTALEDRQISDDLKRFYAAEIATALDRL